MSRPPWDEYFLAIAEAVARRADCTRSHVGAVLVRADHTICSTGYNGVTPGERGCLEGACPRGLLSYGQLPPDVPYDGGIGLCIAAHAEQNALWFRPTSGAPAHTCYVTRKPCEGCHEALRVCGIRRIVWPYGEWNA